MHLSVLTACNHFTYVLLGNPYISLIPNNVSVRMRYLTYGAMMTVQVSWHVTPCGLVYNY